MRSLDIPVTWEGFICSGSRIGVLAWPIVPNYYIYWSKHWHHGQVFGDISQEITGSVLLAGMCCFVPGHFPPGRLLRLLVCLWVKTVSSTKTKEYRVSDNFFISVVWVACWPLAARALTLTWGTPGNRGARLWIRLIQVIDVEIIISWWVGCAFFPFMRR